MKSSRASSAVHLIKSLQGCGLFGQRQDLAHRPSGSVRKGLMMLKKSVASCRLDRAWLQSAVEARKLEHARPPTRNLRKQESQHKSSYIHVPTFWSLLQGLLGAVKVM